MFGLNIYLACTTCPVLCSMAWHSFAGSWSVGCRTSMTLQKPFGSFSSAQTSLRHDVWWDEGDSLHTRHAALWCGFYINVWFLYYCNVELFNTLAICDLPSAATSAYRHITWRNPLQSHWSCDVIMWLQSLWPFVDTFWSMLNLVMWPCECWK